MSGNLPCPLCGHQQSYVRDSRTQDNLVRRRRECVKCNHRYSTHEVVEGSLPKQAYVALSAFRRELMGFVGRINHMLSEEFDNESP